MDDQRSRRCGGGRWFDPVAINDRGQAIFSSRPANGRHRYAFLWADGRVTNLGALDGTRSNIFPATINERGQVVGSGGTSPWDNQGTHAFLWENGSMRDLGTLAPYTTSAATGINDAGQIIGAAAIEREVWYWSSTGNAK